MCICICCVCVHMAVDLCVHARVCVCGGDWASLARMYMCEGGSSSEISCVLVMT